MELETKTVSVVVCKESSEVFDAMEGLIIAIKSGKAAGEIVGSELSRVMTAIDGFEKLSAEAKSDNFYETAGLGGAKLTKALIGK